MLRIGVDTGGTFTDFVVLAGDELKVFKLPSTPRAPEQAVLEGLEPWLEGQSGFLVQHGSTVATNTLLERKGARTVLVTNKGFEDLIEIGRQNRPALYRLSSSRPEPLVPPSHRLGINERSLWTGESLIALEHKSLDWLKNKIKQLKPEAVAVVLLYSYANPEAETRIGEAIASGVPVSLSHQVLPEFREYERTSATVMNAYLAPRMSAYLEALNQDPRLKGGQLTVMQSNGGSTSAGSAASQPLRTLFSGPAGGVTGAFEAARQAGHDRVITFDMGGTSTDVCLCDGEVSLTREASIDNQPVPVHMIAIHSVGAGGGSVAWIDGGGLLRVGPRSAGADPGPVCYGQGEEVTVTDAHLLLGRIDADHFLGGEMALSPERVRPAVEKLAAQLGQGQDRPLSPEEIAEGILAIATTQMQGAIRLISLQKGFDTREFTLVSYGGAGGLHACDLARSLLIPRVLVPPHPGLLSALGILRAAIVKDTSLTVMANSKEGGLAAGLEKSFAPLEDHIRSELEAEGLGGDQIQIDRSVDARYRGQSHEINLPFASDLEQRFHRLHQQYYGYANPGLPVEIVNVRVRGSGRHPTTPIPSFALESEEPPAGALIQEKQVTLGGEATPTRFYLRERLRAGNRIAGPALILEYSSTTLVPADCRLRVDEWMNLVIEPVDQRSISW